MLIRLRALSLLLLLHLPLCICDTSLRQPTCATAGLITALESRQCTDIQPTEADIATMRVLYCLSYHVGLTSLPRCLHTSSNTRGCLATIPTTLFEGYIQLRRRWSALCAAGAAFRLLREISEAVEAVRESGGRVEVGTGVWEARKAAVAVLEANLEALEGLNGLKKVVEGVKGGIVERLREREEEVRKGWKDVEREREEVKKVFWTIREVVRGMQERMERKKEKEEGVRGGLWGDIMLMGCAVVAEGWRWERLAVGGIVGAVLGLEMKGESLGEWVRWGVVGGRVLGVVICAIGLRRRNKAMKREESVEGVSDGRGGARCWEDQSAAVEDDDDVDDERETSELDTDT